MWIQASKSVVRLLGSADLSTKWSDGCPVFETRPRSRKVLVYILHRLPERIRRRLEVFKGSKPLGWFGRYRESPRAMERNALLVFAEKLR